MILLAVFFLTRIRISAVASCAGRARHRVRPGDFLPRPHRPRVARTHQGGDVGGRRRLDRANTATSKDWPTIGLDYAETRFSKLNQITTDNVKKLGLEWTYPLESSRGVEATPVVVDGIMYVTASWSVVHAIDARTGKRIWTYDPGIDKEKGYKGCCDVVNRGVALWKGKVFVGAYDGRLIALDAVTGKKVWEKDTLIDKEHSYTITGAPRVFNGKVMIGNGGAEYGAADTHRLRCRNRQPGLALVHVPGDPSKPFEDDSMAAAAKTWDPAGKYWLNGGGGTAWDTITYDPDLRWSMSAPATARHGIATSAARPAATISICPRSWR